MTKTPQTIVKATKQEL